MSYQRNIMELCPVFIVSVMPQLRSHLPCYREGVVTITRSASMISNDTLWRNIAFRSDRPGVDSWLCWLLCFKLDTLTSLGLHFLNASNENIVAFTMRIKRDSYSSCLDRVCKKHLSNNLLCLYIQPKHTSILCS